MYIYTSNPKTYTTRTTRIHDTPILTLPKIFNLNLYIRTVYIAYITIYTYYNYIGGGILKSGQCGQVIFLADTIGYEAGQNDT